LSRIERNGPERGYYVGFSPTFRTVA